MAKNSLKTACVRGTTVLLLGAITAGCTTATEARYNRGHLEAITPTSLSGVVGLDVVSPPSVRATDANGRPLSNVAVSFTVTGGGTMGTPTAVTDDAGFATVAAWRLGTTAGRQTLEARAGELVVVFTAMAEAGPFAALEAVGGNGQIGQIGAPLAEPLRVGAIDAFGNPIAGTTVSFAVIAGGGTLTGGTAVTGSDGVAASGSWTLGPGAGEQRVRAQSGITQALFTASACVPGSCPELLFVRGANIHRFDAATGETRQLTFDGRSYNPTWSGDGQRIAFANAAPHDAMIVDAYLMNADGSGAQRVTSGQPYHSPAWSPDNKTVALAGDWWLCVYYCSIYLLDVTEPGRSPQRIAPMGTDPAWSPDGKKIAFVSLSGDDGYHALHVMNPDGTGIHELVARDSPAISHPAWSPDGKRIAFSQCSGGRCDIYLVQVDGSGVAQLTSVGDATWPSWSREGTRVAFTRRSFGSQYSIEYVHTTGGDPITLVSNAHSPAWRP